ncbi:MAG TPA: DoxX family protein, partial [Bacteroidales bacterium]|nr:DoxX family protein [Bacteroidales bacterium]
MKKNNPSFTDFALLLFRVLIAVFLFVHGLSKLTEFSTLKETFPDPLGIGSTLSLVAILAAEVGCTVLVAIGLFTRLAAIPVIFGMFMAAFFIHGTDPFQVKELSLLYMGLFTVLLISG